VVAVRDPQAHPSRRGCFGKRGTSVPRRWSRPGETLLGVVYHQKVILARVLPPTPPRVPSPPGDRQCQSPRACLGSVLFPSFPPRSFLSSCVPSGLLALLPSGSGSVEGPVRR